MTKQQLTTLLQLIDEWAAQLKEWELSNACRNSGRDFFTYMQSRGVYAGWMVQVIKDFTGHPPNKLHTVEDAELLRDAIRRYEYSLAVSQNTDENPYDTIRREWS